MNKSRITLPFFCCVFLLAALTSGGCASNTPVTAAPGEADKLLLERGDAALKERQWTRARTFYSELLESYPQSALRADAKLGVGDSYLGENNSGSYVYAQNEYREFLAFYPTNPRADYAQMQLGMVHFNQMLNPQRDQTETKEAIKEFQTFVDRFPNSKLINEVRNAPAPIQGPAVGLAPAGRELLSQHPELLWRRKPVPRHPQGRPGIHAKRFPLLLPGGNPRKIPEKA